MNDKKQRKTSTKKNASGYISEIKYHIPMSFPKMFSVKKEKNVSEAFLAICVFSSFCLLLPHSPTGLEIYHQVLKILVPSLETLTGKFWSGTLPSNEKLHST